MQNPYVAAAARRLLGISTTFNPVPTHTKGSGRDEHEADKEAKAIGIANSRRVKFNQKRESK